MIERQELHCHECNRYVQFNMDMSLNGNHVLECPNCGHEHCRVVKDGVITDDRWDSRNGASIPISYATTTATSTYAVYSASSTATAGTGSGFLYDSWLNVGVC